MKRIADMTRAELMGLLEQIAPGNTLRRLIAEGRGQLHGLFKNPAGRCGWIVEVDYPTEGSESIYITERYGQHHVWELEEIPWSEWSGDVAPTQINMGDAPEHAKARRAANV